MSEKAENDKSVNDKTSTVKEGDITNDKTSTINATDNTNATDNANVINDVKETDNTNVKELAEEKVDELTQALNGIQYLRDANSGVLEKMKQIENKVVFRRFYFPGKTVVLQTFEETLNSENPGFDPRSLPEYIQEARQNGFYRHIIAWNPYNAQYQTMSFADVDQVLRSKLDLDNMNTANKYLKITGGMTSADKQKVKDSVISVLASLDYFDKFAIFFNPIEDATDFTEDEANAITKFYRVDMNSSRKMLVAKINQTAYDFKTLNYGYFAEPQYAFDVAQYIAQYNEYKVQFDEYKQQIWEILRNCPNITLQGNYVGGVFQGNININQSNDVQNQLTTVQQSEATTIPLAEYEQIIAELEAKKQALENAINDTNDKTTIDETSKTATNEENVGDGINKVTKSSDVTGTSKTTTNEENSSERIDKKESTNDTTSNGTNDVKTNDTSTSEGKVDEKKTSEGSTNNETNDANVSKDKTSKNNKTLIIIIIVVVALLLIGIVVFFIVRNHKQKKQVQQYDENM